MGTQTRSAQGSLRLPGGWPMRNRVAMWEIVSWPGRVGRWRSGREESTGTENRRAQAHRKVQEPVARKGRGQSRHKAAIIRQSRGLRDVMVVPTVGGE